MTIAQIKKEAFVEKARKIHGSKYGYENVVYINNKMKVSIICATHGEFLQSPSNHVNHTQGCPHCRVVERAGKTSIGNQEFLKRAKKIHNNKYDYKKVRYKNNKSKVSITCPLHGLFLQTPANHIYHKQGCPTCGLAQRSKTQSLSQQEFFRRAKKIHNRKYDYELAVYLGYAKKLNIVCKEHGLFQQRAGHHLSGIGCPECGRESTSNSQRVRWGEIKTRFRTIHGNAYSYSEANYKGTQKKIKIGCKVHGHFFSTPNKHLSGQGCPFCTNKREGQLKILIASLGTTVEKLTIKKRHYDFYLPDLGLIIERDGEQHYRYAFGLGKDELVYQQKNDKLKTKLALDAGYKLARVPFWVTGEYRLLIELGNIFMGKPTYPNVPDLKQLKTQPMPRGC